MIRCLFLFAVFGLVSSQGFAKSDEDLSKQAFRCTEVITNLVRLACFDKVFSTPANIPLRSDKPDAWLRAQANEMDREGNNDPIITLDGDDKWVTVPAKSKGDDELFPALIFSCISGISRLEMALPAALNDGRVNVAFGGNSAQLWRSDDTGFLIASGRGYIAIRQIKPMLSESTLMVRSNNPAIDGLTFDVSKLKDAILPLREQCGW